MNRTNLARWARTFLAVLISAAAVAVASTAFNDLVADILFTLHWSWITPTVIVAALAAALNRLGSKRPPK